MATLYAKIAGGSWTAAATWSNVNAAGIDNSGPPLAGDDCILEAASGNVTITAASVCRSVNMTSGTGNYAGVLNHDAGFTLTIGDGTAGAGNVALKFVGAGTYTIDNGTTSAIAFISTAGSVQTVDFNGFDTGNVTFNAANTFGWQLTGAWGTSAVNVAQVTNLTKGTLDTNGQTCCWGSFTSVTNTRALTLGASSITLYATTGTRWNIGGSATITCSMASSTITVNAAGVSGTDTFAEGATKTYGTITFAGGGVCAFNANEFTIGTLNFVGSAAKTDGLIFAGTNCTITSTFNIDGNSSINRVLVRATTLGTSRQLTLTGATISGCTNVDFRDITFSKTDGDKNLDFSDITGGSGDCGGNTKLAGDGGGTLSFTVADDWYWHNPDATTPRNFSLNTMWFTATDGGGTRMDADPRETGNCKAMLPQDNAYFDGASMTHGGITVDQDMPRMCKTLDFTGVAAMNFDTNNINQTIYGGFIGVSNVSLNATNSITFEGRSAYNLSTTSGNYLAGNINVNMIGGSLTLISTWSGSTGGAGLFYVNNGTFDANDYSITVAGFSSSNSNARKILLGNGTFTIFGTTSVGSPAGSWVMTTITNLDISSGFAENSMINFSPTQNFSNSFAGGELIYNNISFGATTALTTTLTGSNTFNTFTINAPKTVKFTAGTTTTINNFKAIGIPSKRIIIQSATSRSKATLKTAGGNIQVRNCDIKDLWIANCPWKAYTYDGNIDQGGNSGWTWYAPMKLFVTAIISGWTHTINKVTAANMAKVSTVPKANIAYINKT